MTKTWFKGLFLLIMLLHLAACSHEPKPSKLEVAKGAFDELRAAVRDDIKDPAKAAEVASLVDELEQLMIEASEARKAHKAGLRSLNANYDATEEDFNVFFHEFNTKRSSRQDRFLAIIQQAKTLTTTEERKALAKVRVHAFEAAIKAEEGI